MTHEDLSGYVGLAKDEAQQRARDNGWDPVRAVKPGAILTMEYRQNRLNFEVDGDTVKRCWRG